MFEILKQTYKTLKILNPKILELENLFWNQ
jgi:hypothetical protein